MKETIIVDNKQLGEILGVNEPSVRNYISNNTFEEKLNKRGYKLIKRFKQGRKYVCEIEKENSCKELFSGIAKSMFNTNKVVELSDYIMYRNKNEDLPITKEMLKKLCNVNKNTITKWDKAMIDNGFMSKDGYFYIVKLYDSNGNVLGYELTSEEEYKSYVKNNIYIKKRNKIIDDYNSSKIDKEQMCLMLSGLEDYIRANEGKFVYRVNKYNLAKDNVLFNQIISIIELSITNKEYRQYWLEEEIENNNTLRIDIEENKERKLYEELKKKYEK